MEADRFKPFIVRVGDRGVAAVGHKNRRAVGGVQHEDPLSAASGGALGQMKATSSERAART